MKSIVIEGLEPKKVRRSKILKTSLSLLLTLFVFTMSSPSSFFQFVKPVEAAGTLTSIAILPSNNIVNTRTTYDIMFKTATTGTIKTIQLEFETRFDVSAATRYIERSGIGSGSLSAPSKTTLIYTVTNPVSVAAGTTIRLEIGRIVNSDFAGSFKVTITTKNTSGGTIDGPTLSPSFPIKDITGDDVSPSFMIRKTLHDDAAGNALGWNPNGGTNPLFVSDSDISGSPDNIFVSVMVLTRICATSTIDTNAHLFIVLCNNAPPANSNLDYEIHKLPSHVITSSSLSVSSSESIPSSQSLSQYEFLRAHDQIASEFP